MHHENITKDLIDRKELLFEDGADFFAFCLDDVSAPHAHNFPLREVPEEVLGADLTVEMPIVVPVLERNELNRLVVDIGCEAFLRHGVEFFAFRAQIARPLTVLSVLDEYLLRTLTLGLLLVVDERHKVIWVA